MTVGFYLFLSCGFVEVRESYSFSRLLSPYRDRNYFPSVISGEILGLFEVLISLEFDRDRWNFVRLWWGIWFGGHPNRSDLSLCLSLSLARGGSVLPFSLKFPPASARKISIWAVAVGFKLAGSSLTGWHLEVWVFFCLVVGWYFVELHCCREEEFREVIWQFGGFLVPSLSYMI